MSSSYLSRFLSARESLFRAFVSGGEMLPKLIKELSSLVAEFEHAISQGLVDPDDAQSTTAIASVIKAIVNDFMDIEMESDRLLSAVFEDMALTPSQDLDVTLAEWFLSHLHHPYPSKDEKESLSRQTGASLKQVGAWMSDARKSTGWTTVCQELFDKNRRKASQAARNVYIDCPKPGIPTSDVCHAFLVVRSKAEKLLSNAEEQVIITAGCRPVAESAEVDAFPGLVVEKNVGISYPGGTWLLTGGESVCSDDSEEEDTTPPPPVAGAKRRRDESSDEPILLKRPRSHRASSVLTTRGNVHTTPPLNFSTAATSTCPTPTCVISLSTGVECTSDELFNISPPIFTEPSPSPPPSRKRRADETFVEQSDSKRVRSSTESSSPVDDLLGAFPPGLVQLQSLDHCTDVPFTSEGLDASDISAWELALNSSDGLSSNKNNFSPSGIFGEVAPSLSADAFWSTGFAWPNDSMDSLALFPNFDGPSTTHLSVQRSELESGGKSAYDAHCASLLFETREDESLSLSLSSSEDDSTPSLSPPCDSDASSSSGVHTPESVSASPESQADAVGRRWKSSWLRSCHSLIPF